MPAAGLNGADLRHVDTWLFDLDNTLYPPEAGILDLVEGKILAYFMALTGLPKDEAWALQRGYLEEHGSAVPGLVRHHDVDPHDYLRAAHDVSLDALTPDPRLKSALERLPGRRLVFTNGSRRHAERVLERLDLTDAFDDVFHAEAADLLAKPDPRAFQALISALAVAPRATAFFEDRAVNLAPAAALGMTTVLVGAEADASTASFVHFRTAALHPFLEAARLSEPRL
jgi:putative hydrolase of the HAD superfamily